MEAVETWFIIAKRVITLERGCGGCTANRFAWLSKLRR
jgi:hypothetical protein